MYTFAHPHAPTIRYICELKKAIASYAINHLSEFDVYLTDAQQSEIGIAMEVFSKATGEPVGHVTIQ